MTEYSESHRRVFSRYQAADYDLGALTDRERAVLAREDVNFRDAIKTWQQKHAKAAPAPGDALRFLGSYTSRGYSTGSVTFFAESLWIACRDTSDPPGVEGSAWELLVRNGGAL